jgi:hypothetical protein
MAGYGMMLSLSLVFGLPLFQGRGPALAFPSELLRTGWESDPSAYPASSPPSISITIEPAVLTPIAGAESPVVFPGYLLPDDGCEEPAHAGS